MIRTVLYARYSTELQSSASIADQHRALRLALPRLGLTEVGAQGDAAISGRSLARPGLDAALAEIEAGRADVLFAEALDRISRDLEHVARIAKRVHYRGARIITLSEGEISALHIGLDPAIVDGMVARLNAMAARKRELQAELEVLPTRDEVIDITRVSADYLSRNLTRLWAELTAQDADGSASRALRALISRVIMHPESERGRYRLEIEGDAAVFMGLAEDGEAGLQKVMVAGVGFEPTTFRL